MYEYKATCIRVVDGDTYEMDIDLGFGIHIRGDHVPAATIRLMGIDTPETHNTRNSRPKEYEHGIAARKRVEDLFFLWDSVDSEEVAVDLVLRTEKAPDFGKYGRFLAEVLLPDGRSLTNILIDEGFEKKSREEYEANILKGEE